MPHLKREVAKISDRNFKIAKTTMPIFDGGVLRGRCCNYSISLDGLFSIQLTLITNYALRITNYFTSMLSP